MTELPARRSPDPPFRRAAARALLALLIALAAPGVAAAQALERAHAHNDYLHPRPLLDALDHGFNSVEADVHLVGGELLVAHDPEEVRPGLTLERLYLAPLRERVRANGGRVHPGMPPLLLLIDIKTDADATYAALHDLLRRYADVLTIFAGDAAVEGAVTAVISGNRPRATMRAAPVRFAAYDGRLPDLEPGAAAEPPSFMPLVSNNWSAISQWRGEGPPPDSLRREVARLADLAHAQGRRLRFWGTPDNEAVWGLLHDAGVDLINTDDLAGLRAFLLRQRTARP